jgi:hypothetical protein
VVIATNTAITRTVTKVTEIACGFGTMFPSWDQTLGLVCIGRSRRHL